MVIRKNVTGSTGNTHPVWVMPSFPIWEGLLETVERTSDRGSFATPDHHGGPGGSNRLDIEGKTCHPVCLIISEVVRLVSGIDVRRAFSTRATTMPT